MKLVALSGGIASGKSTIARRLGELGAVHIDADVLARKAVAVGAPAITEIRKRFGPGVVTPDGALDRQALGDIVFQNEDDLAALNAIVHPRVRDLAQREIAEARSENPDAIVVYDVPLLVEAGVQLPWDMVVIAEAPEETRKQRMIELRGMTPEEAARRIESQASDAERREFADVIIDTGGSLQHTLEQADALWRSLRDQG